MLLLKSWTDWPTDRGKKETVLAKRPFSHHKNSLSVCVRVCAPCASSQSNWENWPLSVFKLQFLILFRPMQQFKTPNSLEIRRKTSNRATLKHHLFWSVYVSLFLCYSHFKWKTMKNRMAKRWKDKEKKKIKHEMFHTPFHITNRLTIFSLTGCGWASFNFRRFLWFFFSLSLFLCIVRKIEHPNRERMNTVFIQQNESNNINNTPNDRRRGYGEKRQTYDIQYNIE